MTDGHFSIAILKVARDQIGVGLDYRGLHHVGLVVDDLDAWTKHLESLGVPNITTLADMPATVHIEIPLSTQSVPFASTLRQLGSISSAGQTCSNGTRAVFCTSRTLCASAASYSQTIRRRSAEK
jgi:hypothetical protein